jgi:PAS domain S-box-containing protein
MRWAKFALKLGFEAIFEVYSMGERLFNSRRKTGGVSGTTGQRGLSIARVMVWLVFIVLLVTTIAVRQKPFPFTLGPLWLVLALDFVFLTLGSLLVAYVAASSYLGRGRISILLFGCGMWTIAIISTGRGILVPNGFFSIGIKLSYYGFLIAGLCHFSGAVCSFSQKAPKRGYWRMLTGFFGGIAAILILLTYSEVTGFIRIGKGFMFPAALLFYMAALLVIIRNRQLRSEFYFWYSSGLVLIGTGLITILMVQEAGEALYWVGRVSEYAGVGYIVIAALKSNDSGAPKRIITLQKKLSEVEGRYEQLVECCADAIMVYIGGRYVFANPAAAKLFGAKSEEDLLGLEIKNLMPNLAARCVESRKRKNLRMRETPFFETTVSRFNGQKVEVEAVCSPIRYEHKAATQVVLRDIRYRKKIEYELIKARNELEERVKQRTRQLTKTVDTLQDEVEHRIATEQRLGEANTELAKRANQLSRLINQLNLTEQRERGRLARVLHDQLQQLLVAAKLQLGILDRSLKDERLLNVVKSTTSLLTESIEESRNLTTELSPPILHSAGLIGGLRWLGAWFEKNDLFHVNLELSEEADSEETDVCILIFQIAKELLFNTVKHSGVKEAYLRLWKPKEGVVAMTVRDEGKGFDVESMSTETAEGFGLFGIRERLTAAGGSLEVQSSVGKGARFTLTLPYSSDLDSTTGEMDSASEGESGEKAINIIVADDRATTRQGVISLLEHEKDMNIICETGDIEEVKQMAEEMDCDVILLNNKIKGNENLELLKLIHRKFCDIGVVVFSSLDNSEQKQAILNAGACAYIDKSQNARHLVETIRSVYNPTEKIAGERDG